MSIEKLIEFATTGDRNTDELDLDRGFPSRIYPARQWFNWLFNSLTVKINEIIDNKVDKTAISELSGSEANEGSGTDSKLISAKVLKDAIVIHAPTPADATTEVKGIVQLNNTLTSTSTAQALTAAQGKVLNDQAFGVNQTAKGIVAKVANTSYRNDTGKTLFITIKTSIGTSTTGNSIVIGGNTWCDFDTYTSQSYAISFMVQADAEYIVNSINPLISWSEFTV